MIDLKLYRYWFLLFISINCCLIFAQKNNENTTTLNEIIVKNSNAYIDGEKIVFIPTKSEKYLSTDISSLISNMGTGLLRVENGKVKSISAGDVNIFFNGIAADEMDLSTFWPKNVIRVEYYETPTDPKFSGKRNVVNIVVKDYIFGGLTKLSADQEVPNSGNYSISSMLKYNKLSFNVLIKEVYFKDYNSGYDGWEKYRDIWYDDEFYGEVLKHESDCKSNIRNNTWYAGFNARYVGKNFKATHGLYSRWDKNPGSGSTYNVSYYPKVITSESSSIYNRDLKNVQSVTGNYELAVGRRLYFTYYWKYVHGNNNSFSSFLDDGLPPIFNSAEENIHRFISGLTTQYSPFSKMWITGILNGYSSTYDTLYKGSLEARRHNRESCGQISLSCNYYWNQIFTYTISGDLKYNTHNIGGYKYNEKEFNYYGGIEAALNSKTHISFQGGIAPNVPESFMRNNLILRQTELKWLEGNPDIKQQHYRYIQLNCSYFPSNIFSLSGSLSLSIRSNEVMIQYKSGGTLYDGIVAKYENAGKCRDMKIYIVPYIKLFHNTFRINLETNYDHYKYLGIGGDVKNLRFRPSLSFMKGNHMVSINYMSPLKTYENGGLRRVTSGSLYSLDYTYGNGNLYSSISINNIFGKKNYFDTYENNGVYSSMKRNFERGRMVNVHLTYTFDYGKKNDKSIDINEEGEISSGILR